MEQVSPNDLYKQGPPKFGHDLLKYFPLDPDYIGLNHGILQLTINWAIYESLLQDHMVYRPTSSTKSGMTSR